MNVILNQNLPFALEVLCIILCAGGVTFYGILIWLLIQKFLDEYKDKQYKKGYESGYDRGRDRGFDEARAMFIAEEKRKQCHQETQE